MAAYVNSKDFMDKFPKILPKTYRAKCLYKYMLSSTDMIKPDGRIQNIKFNAFVKQSGIYDDATSTKITQAVNKCQYRKQVSIDKCENVGLFVNCAAEEAWKNELSPFTMLEAIRLPFFAKKAISNY